MIDCMTCLVQLGDGCPTNGLTTRSNGVTHAMVTICGTSFNGIKYVPAHGFRWSKIAGRWMFFVGTESFWAARDLL